MSPGERQRGGPSRLSLQGGRETSSLEEARKLLGHHLVHTREVANGRDFLFSGPKEKLHEALRRLVEFEHRRETGLKLDFAEIEEYFLLRITGAPLLQGQISGYFGGSTG